MKTLRKALASVLAVSVLAFSCSALAAVEGNCTLTGEGATFDASYNVSGKSLTATATGAKSGEQTTFLILDQDANVSNIAGDDILYIDQKEATAGTTSFTGVINLARVTGATTEIPTGSYPVRFGYYDSTGDFQIAAGNLVISEVIPAAVVSITTDETATATAGTPLAITATVVAVGGASEEYTWTVTSQPAGSTATVTDGNFVADKVGTYVVTATATDDGTKTDTKTITVVDSAPTLTSASIDGASTGFTDGTVELTGSYVNEGKPNVTLTWSVSGPATLSAETGATTTVTPSGAGTVTVTLTATSETGVVVTDTHEIEFTVKPAGTKVTIVWGDVDASGSVASADITALLMRSIGGKTTFTDKVSKKSFTIGTAYDGIVWGDVDASGSVASADITALLMRSIGGKTTFTNKTTSKSYTIGNSYELNLTE